MVRRIDTYHHAKFSRNWSIQSRHIVIFRVFKMAAAAVLNSWNREILLAVGVERVETHQHAKFHQNPICCEDIKIYRFFKMAAVRHLGFVWDLFGPPTVSTCGLCHSAKFGYDPFSSFYNMNISIFDTFGWKTPIHALKIGGFGQVDPLNGLQYQPKPKRHTLAWVPVIWAIKRENVVNGLTCMWVA